jgi:hypothetical protein
LRHVKLCGVFFLLTVLSLSSLIMTQAASCQAQNKNVTYTLYFHNYSTLIQDSNGSFVAYNGADGATPTGTGSQVTLQSQITGTRDGWSYYSAVAIWAAPLQSDLHVKGTVTVTAYLSSKFSLSGLFSGGSYGFGLVDIDENNAEVNEFISEGPVAIGSNPFTQEPTRYSLSVNVDHVFKKGHAVGFAVGFGATVQGFDATIYFDSPNRNSGVTLPVEVAMTSQTFTVQSGGASSNVQVQSDSAVSDFQFDASTKQLKFKAQGIPYTTGSCIVAVPKTLMQAPFSVTCGGQQVQTQVSEDQTLTHISFMHTRTDETIIITSGDDPAASTATSVAPEYPAVTVFPVVVAVCVATLLTATFLWLRRNKK